MSTDGLDIENPATLRQYVAAKGLLSESEEATITALPGGVSGRTVLAIEAESRLPVAAWPNGE